MKKTWRDIYVKLSDGTDLRYSEYVRKMQQEFDMFDFINEEELARIEKEEEEILAQR